MIDITDNYIRIKNKALYGNEIEISLKEIESRNYAKGENFSICAGSFVDGLATPYSDLDIIVFCERTPSLQDFDYQKHNGNFTTYNGWLSNKEKTIWSTHEFIGNLPLQLEITYMPIQSIEALGNQIDFLFNSSHNKEIILARPFISAGGLSLSQKELAHRILTGICINNSLLYEKHKFFLCQEKFCFINYLELRPKYTYFKDILGLIMTNRLLQAKVLLDKMIINLIICLLQLNLISNTKSKWAIEIFFDLPDEYQSLKQLVNKFLSPNQKIDNNYLYFGVALFDEFFSKFIDLLDKNFSSVVRRDYHKLYSQAFINKASTHPEILRAQAFGERYTSKRFVPITEFMNFEKTIEPTMTFL